MKIEIEFEEVERLKKQLSEKDEIIKTYQEKILSLREDVMNRKAITLAHNMFYSVIESVFEKLGFKTLSFNRVGYFTFKEVDKHLEKSDSDKIEVIYGVEITNEFREAFLKLGIKVDDVT